MAVPQNTLIGKTKQSVGNATFTTWKGINVLKSKPVSVANPRTQGQVNQRQKMSNFVAFYRKNAAIFNAGFRQQAVKQSAYNAAASTNMTNFSIGDDPAVIFDNIELLETGKGSLYPAPITVATATAAGNSATVNWDDTPFADQLNSDKAYVLILGDDGVTLGQGLASSSRADGNIIVNNLDQIQLGDTIYAYLFFVQTSTGKVSNSDEIGIVVGA